MGSIYRRRDTRNYWIKYYVDGKARYESSGSHRYADARALLRDREAAAEKGGAAAIPTKVTVGEALARVADDYRVNGRRSGRNVAQRSTRLAEYFRPGTLLRKVTSAGIQTYVARRLEAGLANATINRELAVLRRACWLAVESGELVTVPVFPHLAEAAPRAGFFEEAQLSAVLRHLDQDLADLVVFASVTGWRVSEVKGLEWRHVELESGVVRLDPGTTKNLEGRVFPLTGALRSILARRKAGREGLAVRHVFTRGGRPVKDFRRSWSKACTAAGCPGRLVHDLRRTAVRNLVRAGVPERVAMQLTGHKTRSVFERYNIVSERDLREAAATLERARV